MTALRQSWIASANDPNGPFPLNNLPYGVFSTEDGEKRCGVAIGDKILDVSAMEAAGTFSLMGGRAFLFPNWNGLMKKGPLVWKAFRNVISGMLSTDPSPCPGDDRNCVLEARLAQDPEVGSSALQELVSELLDRRWALAGAAEQARNIELGRAAMASPPPSSDTGTEFLGVLVDTTRCIGCRRSRPRPRCQRPRNRCE